MYQEKNQKARYHQIERAHPYQFRTKKQQIRPINRPQTQKGTADRKLAVVLETKLPFRCSIPKSGPSSPPQVHFFLYTTKNFYHHPWIVVNHPTCWQSVPRRRANAPATQADRCFLAKCVSKTGSRATYLNQAQNDLDTKSVRLPGQLIKESWSSKIRRRGGGNPRPHIPNFVTNETKQPKLRAE